MHRYILAPLVPDGADWQRHRPVGAPVRLTAVQWRIYCFIRERQQVWGETPSYREIAGGCQLSGISAVRRHMVDLMALDVLSKPYDLARAIVLHHVLVRPVTVTETPLPLDTGQLPVVYR